MKNGKAILAEPESEKIKILFELYNSGLSMADASKKSGVNKCHYSIGKMLSNKKYLGDDFYPKIIESEIFEKAQILRKQKVESLNRNEKLISPFASLVHCETCGNMYKKYIYKSKEIWCCASSPPYEKSKCKSPRLSEAELEESFLKMIRKLNPDNIKSDKINHIIIGRKTSDPFKQAEYVYSLVSGEKPEIKAKEFVEIISENPKMFDMNFLKRIVKNIFISCDKEISFMLINNQIFKGDDFDECEYIHDPVKAEI